MDQPHILVIEDDPLTREVLQDILTTAGFGVTLAATGTEGLESLRHAIPSLVLLDQMLPDLPGIEVCQRIRREPGTGAVPVVMLTALSRSTDQVAGLEAGADDYVTKPFVMDELIARLRSHLRRSRRERQLNPLTGLPGNLAIDQETENYLASGKPFAIAWVDLDNFKAYNDRYGFFSGDQVIERTGRLLCDVVDQIGPDESFTGHIGGDDFVLLLPMDQMERAGALIAEGFDAIVPSFYTPEDVAHGYITAVGRTGEERHFPLVSISVALVPCPPGRFSHPAEIAQVAAEIKHFLKQRDGSGWLIDRRANESAADRLANPTTPPASSATTEAPTTDATEPPAAPAPAIC